MALYEPLPCPACGSIKVGITRSHAQFKPSFPDDDKHHVRCFYCRTSGPYGYNESAAIVAWNALPRMSTIIAWQFQAAGLALALQRLEDRGQSLRNAQWLAGRYSCFAKEAHEVGREFDTALADARKVLESR
jgi:hypothetical protein